MPMTYEEYQKSKWYNPYGDEPVERDPSKFMDPSWNPLGIDQKAHQKRVEIEMAMLNVNPSIPAGLQNVIDAAAREASRTGDTGNGYTTGQWNSPADPYLQAAVVKDVKVGDKYYRVMVITNMTQYGKFTTDEVAHIQAVKMHIQSFVLDVLKKINLNLYTMGDWGEAFLSGGAIASLLQGDDPMDWDIFFHTYRARNLIVDIFNNGNNRDKMVDMIKDSRLTDNPYYQGTFYREGKAVTENGITLKNGIQFVTRYYGDVSEVHSSFDFVHCLPWYSIREDKLYITKQQYDCCVNKVLIVNKEFTKEVDKYRVDKFLNRGYMW